MTTGCHILDPSAAYYLTHTVVDWVDVFTRKTHRDIIIDSMKYCREHKGLKIGGYVLMSNHLHWLVSAKNGNLSDVIRDFKRHTASHVLKLIKEPTESRSDWILKRFEFAARSNARNGQYQFWTHDNHPEFLYSRKFSLQKLNYIHLNPVRAGLVKQPEHWMYSSASNYLCQESLLEIDLMNVFD